MMRMACLLALAASAGFVPPAGADQTQAERARERAAILSDEPVAPDAPYVSTPAVVVQRMLDLAEVGPGDVLYDLGSGDGRIVIAAARRGARAVGVEIDPDLVLESRTRSQAAGVEDRVTFLCQDLFDTDFSEATIVTLYLLPGLNMKLRPKLLAELRPGARVVSNSFHMGDWAPERTARVGGARLVLWVVPQPGGRAGD